MKTSVCLAVICVLAAFALSVEARHPKKCYETYIQRITVPQLVTYRLFIWGRWFTFRQYVFTTRLVTRSREIPCPVNCQWDDWKPNGEWGICSVTCGKGLEEQLLTRKIKIAAKYGGKPCEGPNQKLDYRSCDMLDCPSTICKEKKNGHHAHLQICAKHIHCENGKAHVKKCAEGTAWDRDSMADNKCTSEGLDKCDGIACIRGMIYPDQRDCRLYHKCDHNRLHQKKCPETEPYFDMQLSTCTARRDACGKPGKPIEVLECDDQFGNITDRAHCNKFFQCVHGKPVSQLCPPGTLFDPSRQLCDHKSSVTCINEDEEDEEEEKPEPEICLNGEFTTDSDDFNVYYQCVHGKKVEQKCPAGLIFDVALKVCNYP
ncbi:uncharacterized protein LOC117330587 [Pecten maximus]|uniref:uncharacterized protein LOC117330587 n=1 Tax=Pecten maximus TaxID=6579 RepID=UPI0014589DC9|nr:uncharacterized protein LOC117330587 [Pecten maximus]